MDISHRSLNCSGTIKQNGFQKTLIDLSNLVLDIQNDCNKARLQNLGVSNNQNDMAIILQHEPANEENAFESKEFSGRLKYEKISDLLNEPSNETLQVQSNNLNSVQLNTEEFTDKITTEETTSEIRIELRDEIKTEDAIPIIDVSSLYGNDRAAKQTVAAELRRACTVYGFFYITGHGVELGLTERVDKLAREFFALPLEEKMEIAMEGPEWLGYFPMQGEKTSGKPDCKEGIWFGNELPPTDPRVLANYPSHGTNKYHGNPKEFRSTVTEYMKACSLAGRAVMEGIALSLGLDGDYFERNYTREACVQLGLMYYPPIKSKEEWEESWGVGSHTDYGLLTLLHQDYIGGLQIRTLSGTWIEAKPIPGTLICNIGDMLDRLTGGYYRSTLHRVKNSSGGPNRLSLPFFFDSNALAVIRSLPEHSNHVIIDDKESRWDNESVHEFQGTFGDYLKRKVSRIF
jgi:isopenicillin N synthase-like dioxygenase